MRRNFSFSPTHFPTQALPIDVSGFDEGPSSAAAAASSPCDAGSSSGGLSEFQQQQAMLDLSESDLSDEVEF